MKYLVILVLSLAAFPCLAASDCAILAAIAQVETHNRPEVIGCAGERSAWQFTSATWHEYTSANFFKATTDPLLASLVARAHLQRIRQELRAYHLADSVTNIAACWNGGVGTARRNGARPAAYSYGQRVENLVRDSARKVKP